jgi:hypothetical protein
VSFDRKTPTRPLLSSVRHESGGNGDRDVRSERPPPEDRIDACLEAATRAAESVVEVWSAIGKLTSEVSGVRDEVRELRGVIVARVAIRQPAPSFTDISTDDADEIITDHGTRKYAYSDEQLRAKMRREYSAMLAHDKLVEDAETTRALKRRGTATVWALISAALLAALGAIVAALRAKP